MKQVTQRLRDGELRVVDVPEPELDEWKVLVRTEASLVSAGTERAKVEVARESLLGKARRRPDQVRQVLERIRSDGLRPTVTAVRARLDALSPLGYCAAGIVQEVGRRVSDMTPGDLVACGGDAAAHAEVLAVPGNLCVRVPSGVDGVSAAFTTIGAIAMHGVRQADVRLGERVAVVGLGLVGQLSARIARAAGCEVLGVDLEDWRLRAAEAAGAVDIARLRADVPNGQSDSWDAVLVTAAAPGSSDPVTLAVDLARERGTIVVVGDVGLELDRRTLYAKELQLRLARSYGPGRYDVEYEERGLDYPLSYVRWTERRNMAEFLRLVAERRVSVQDLITHRFPIAQAADAFELLTDEKTHAFGVLIEYDEHPVSEPAAVEVRRRAFTPGARVGFIGAGSFARRVLIPLAKRHGLVLDRVATASGLSAAAAAEQFAFSRGACRVAELLTDEQIAGVVIATRHERHASLTLEALRAGKAVFVEKPLCLTTSELDEIEAELARPDTPPLIVGFNRRHAPATARLREHLRAASGPTNVVVRVNAPPLPDDHWLNDPGSGGGRLVGEGCHFLDLLCHLAGVPPVAVTARAKPSSGRPVSTSEDFVVVVEFADGSLGTLLYATAGAPSLGKEFVEAHRGRRSGRIDDFRRVELWGDGRGRTFRSRGRDKGHAEEVRTFSEVLRGERPAPGGEAALVSTRLTLAALEALETGVAQRVDAPQSGVEA